MKVTKNPLWKCNNIYKNIERIAMFLVSLVDLQNKNGSPTMGVYYTGSCSLHTILSWKDTKMVVGFDSL